MSVENPEPFPSIETKHDELSPEDEVNHLKSRIASQQLVLKKVQQDLSLYKTRCAGVDTIEQLLKEAKTENNKISKQKMALETAVVNLQNRLLTNGLSSSLSITDNEVFVPGESKQTLDNLAKENVRLRNLLKGSEVQTFKREEEEPSSLKERLEDLESENNKLKAQIVEHEGMKLVMANQYEDALESLRNELRQVPKDNKISQEIISSSSGTSNCSSNIVNISKSTQTVESCWSIKDHIKLVLSEITNKCRDLSDNLDSTANVQSLESMGSGIRDNDQTFNETTQKLQKDLQEAILMNSRWQQYCAEKDNKIHDLATQLADFNTSEAVTQQVSRAVELFRQESEILKRQLLDKNKEIEHWKLQLQIEKESVKSSKASQVDTGYVEILKQQIQVCTEDFNTERKDREQAVNKVKQLQEQVSVLQQELQQRKLKDNELEYASRKTSQVFQNYSEGNYLEGDLYRRTVYENQPITNPRPNVMPATSPMAGASTRYSQPSTSAVRQKQMSYEANRSPQKTVTPEMASLPRLSQRVGVSEISGGNFVTSELTTMPSNTLSPSTSTRIQTPENQGSPSKANSLSMPVLSQRSPRPRQHLLRTGEYLTCPVCNKVFTEENSQELIKHMNTCAD